MHDRIMRSLEGSGAEPAAVEPLEPAPVEVETPEPVVEPEPAEPAPEPTNAEVREWARAQDPPIEVSDSGPVPKLVREAYDAAHEA